MTSSGIKRGLAATAVAALAVAGIPALASSASAGTGDSLAVASQGPIRNGNAAGGVITLKGSTDDLTLANLLVTNASYGDPVPAGAGTEISSPAFDVDVISVDRLDGNAPTTPAVDDVFPDGTYHYDVVTAVTSGSSATATFGLVEDADANGTASASDPKTTVTVTPTGAPTQVDVSTAQPATVEGQPVKFDVEIKDAANNLTQLVAGEEFDITASGGAAIAPDAVLDSADLKTGKASFTATPAVASPDTMTVTVTGSAPPAATITDSATVTVYDNATITTDEFDLVTGADNWIQGTTAFGSVDRQVRVDQTEVTFSITSKDGVDADTIPDDAGKVVGFAVTSATMTINGKAPAAQPAVVPVLLGADGKGTGVLTLSGVTAGAQLTFSAPGSTIAATTLTFNRPSATTVATDSGAYVTKVGSPTAVTVSVKDQFSNPIGGPAQVSITRNPVAPRTANAGTTARVTVDATGKATINLPDAGTTVGSEVLDVNLYDDQFDPSATTTAAAATIYYTADGLGGDFVIGGATSDAAATTATPLYDGKANGAPGTDYENLTIAAGTPGAVASVSVDNGALILTSAETDLNQGSATQDFTLAGGAAAFKVIGTKTGVVTVTIVSGGRTKTVKLTIVQPAAGPARVATARNVAITAPEKASAGSVATWVVKVTDAFGNPVSGVTPANLSLQVSGPANLQGTDAATDGNGEMKVNVILTDNANSAVGVRVTGVIDAATQFGDAANVVDGAAAPGVTASDNTATAAVTDVVNLAELQRAVDEAQALVERAQDNLASAKGDLTVAKAKKQVAMDAVKAAKKDLKQAKKKHKGVRAAKAALRAAKGDKKIAQAEVTAAQDVVNIMKTRLAQAEEILAAAQAALDEAQN